MARVRRSGDEEEDDPLLALRLGVLPLEVDLDLPPLPLWVLLFLFRLWDPLDPLLDVDRDLDLILLLFWGLTDLDRDRRLSLSSLFLFCAAEVVVGLESFRPNPFRFCVCCWLVVDLLVSESAVAVFPVLCPDACCLDPGDSGGVELVTGANTVSLLTITSHSPLELNLGASSANTM